MNTPLLNLISAVIAIISLLTVLYIYYIKNLSLKKKLVFEEDRYSQYAKEINELKNSKELPKKVFKKIIKIIRSYFNEYFGIRFNLTYTELAKRFKNENKDFSDFFNLIEKLNYSGEEITNEDILKVTELFEKIIKEN